MAAVARDDPWRQLLVTAHGDTHSLNLARAGNYPLLAEGDLVLAWKFPQ